MQMGNLPKIDCLCECGCGFKLPLGNQKRRFIRGHQGRMVTPSRRRYYEKMSQRNRIQNWNRGKTYIFSSKSNYKTKHSWKFALLKCFENKCMICGWNQAPCDGHHIIPKSGGGRNALENGIILCPNHHRLVHHGKISTDELIRIRSTQVPKVMMV